MHCAAAGESDGLGSFVERGKTLEGSMKSRAMMMAVVVGLCSLFAQYAHAGTVTGTVTQIFLRDSDGLMYVALSGTPSGRPACASATNYWMVPNETTDSGKRLYAALLAAKMSGRTIVIVGKNTCTRWLDGEDI